MEGAHLNKFTESERIRKIIWIIFSAIININSALQKIGRFKFGGRLRGLKSKLLINKMIEMHIRCKMGRFRFGGRLRGLNIKITY